MATSVSRSSSRARHTSPYPPAPSFSISTKRPHSWVPAWFWFVTVQQSGSSAQPEGGLTLLDEVVVVVVVGAVGPAGGGAAAAPVSSSYSCLSSLRHSRYWSSAVPVSRNVWPSTSTTCGATSDWKLSVSSFSASACVRASAYFLTPESTAAIPPMVPALRAAFSMRRQL